MNPKIIILNSDDGCLDKKTYLQIVKHTTLVSVDLIIFDEEDKVLVGKRKNNPAKNTYFVPGSRIYKSETVKTSIPRVCKYELGVELNNPVFRGVYEHEYKNNFDNNDFGTHYINFAYSFHINNKMKKKIQNSVFFDQHFDVCWMNVCELLERHDVHHICKTHFAFDPDNQIV
jgi:colanic acid biosynthesis protein WcaH